MSLCPSPNQTIVAGYVAAFEPYHSACIRQANWQHSCKRPGFVIELWLELAKAFGCELQLVQFFDFGAFAPAENNSWGGLMEALSMGTVDGTASHLVFSSARVEAFQSATVFGETVNQFIARSQMTEERALNLAVFSWPIFAYLLASIVLCGIFYHFTAKNHVCRPFGCFWHSFDELMHFVDRRRTILSYFLACSCLLLQLAYFAEFRSRAVESKRFENAKFDQLLQEFRSGSKKLIITNKAHIKDADKLLLFGKINMENDSRLTLIEDYKTSLKMICENNQYLLLGNIIELWAVKKAYQICNYRPIEITSPTEDDFLLYHMSNLVPHGILFGRHVKQEVVEKMNEIILKLFKEEDFINRWYPRYGTKMNTASDLPIVDSAVPPSIRLAELKDGFKFWFSGIAISTAAFIIAIVFKHKRPIHQWSSQILFRNTTYLPRIALSVYVCERPLEFQIIRDRMDQFEL